MHSLLPPLLLLLLAATLASGREVLLFDRSDTQLSLQSSAHARLWTLPAEATMADVLASEGLARALCPVGQRLAVVEGRDAIEAGTVLGCSNSNALYTLLPSPRGPGPKPVLRLEELTNPDTVARSKAYWERVHSQPREYPFEPVQIMGDGVSEALAWAYQFVTHHWGARPAYPAWSNRTGVFHLGSGAALPGTGRGYTRVDDAAPVRLAVAGDWASGTREADYVAQRIAAGRPDHTVHLGDVYLVGTADEIRSNVLGQAPPGAEKGVQWPRGSRGTWAIEGNHEAFSRSQPYFDTLLPELTAGVQESGYFMLENSFYRLVFLDTGFNTYSPLINSKNNTQPDVVMEWLRSDAVALGNASDTRPVVLFTHHQFKSAFGSPYLATPEQLAALLPPGRSVLWFWGHEHRLALYELGADPTVPIKAYGRCVGVGGFPTSLAATPPNARSAGLEAYDDRVFATVDGLLKIPVGYNGWTELLLDGPTLTVEYKSLASASPGVPSNTTETLLMTEVFQPDGAGGVERVSFTVVDKNVTVVQSV